MDDAQLWRRRPSEARLRADAEPDPTIKRKLKGISRSYEAMADRAEERAGRGHVALSGGGHGAQSPPCAFRDHRRRVDGVRK